MKPFAAEEQRPRLSLILLLILGFAVLVVARMPEIVLKGRFWAEEGRNFFAAAATLPPLRALFNSYGGYLNLVANAATLAARLVMPLRLAPYMTIAVGLAFQLLPPLLLLTARDEWLGRMRVRIAGILLILLVPATEEIWLQTLHCQFELTLCCGIILALEPAAGLAALARLAILALTPLCGPGGIVLIPLFLARAALDRSAARLLQGLTLAAASAVQILVFFQPFAGRAYHLDPLMLLCVVAIRHIVEPFFGLTVAYRAGHDVQNQLAAGHVALWAVLLPVALFVPFVVVLLRTRRAAASRWLLAAAVFTAPAAYYGALGGTAMLIGAQSGERYIFVPQALLALAVLALAATSTRRIARAAWSAVVWLMVIGAIMYPETLPLIRNGPAWRDQVRAWQLDPSHRLRIWPDGWTVTLAPG
ncbi:hypothetical protein [Lichenicola sp.]|uniref:hypothetical protein n=1 Tax=Lichenicola sp. TaxID=2804529 RepID=UPI003AFF7AF2